MKLLLGLLLVICCSDLDTDYMRRCQLRLLMVSSLSHRRDLDFGFIDGHPHR